jgi:hypothetical protein
MPSIRYGSRTFWLTKGMVDRNADPQAYLMESTEIDEEFVEGRIIGIKAHLSGLMLPSKDASVMEAAISHILDAPPSAAFCI